MTTMGTDQRGIHQADNVSGFAKPWYINTHIVLVARCPKIQTQLEGQTGLPLLAEYFSTKKSRCGFQTHGKFKSKSLAASRRGSTRDHSTVGWCASTH
jgi:hypothetical protein